MGELAIRRNRGFAPTRLPETGRAEKSASTGPAQKTVGKSGLTVSETLQQLMTKASQVEESARAAHRTLQTGEVVLDEVQDALSHMAELAQEAAGEGDPDRDTLQAQLDQLRQEIDRILSGASTGDTKLFLDGQGQSSALPGWLASGVSQGAMTPEQILSSLGLDENSSVQDVMKALSGSSLEDNPAASRLAALYLGAVISAGGSLNGLDVSNASEGLRQLLAQMAQGLSPDQAVSLLTNGAFTGLSDFQSQFTSGELPGFQDFLFDLLFSGNGSAGVLADPALLELLAGIGETGVMDLELMLDLLDIVQTLGDPAEAIAPDTAEGMAPPPEAVPDPVPSATMQFGTVQVTGRDLSGVAYDEDSGVLTIGGEANVTVQGSGQEAQAIRLTGSGTVTLLDTTVSMLTASSSEARIACTGGAVLGEVRLDQGAALTLEGGPVRIGVLLGGSSNTLRLAAGASVRVGTEAPGTVPFPVVLEGPASLAAHAAAVSDSSGKTMEAFDNLWKALLPNWSAITELTMDGRQAKLALAFQDPARLWLTRGDPSQGSPIHAVIIRGKDASARPKVRYAYLRWNQEARAFEEVSMYPNPFKVTGGEEGLDWIYEAETQTLRILTDQVTAISGGPGTDARRESFSGRIALEDGIGAINLTLDGVFCRVDEGQAFHLGRDNEVTLVLQNGTRSLFESGPGHAGISLGENASLTIDRAEPLDGNRTPSGALTASGNGGGAGIGRDKGAGRSQEVRIQIRGGKVTASGSGGGAGIGSGKRGAMGDVTITGGEVSASGNGGGAGIGGALSAPVGDIVIQGGRITAAASSHAAAIGAGVQGTCGDITVTGTARILKALGGDPGADIGGCLFGGCGKVLISGAADIGRAKLWTQPGVSLQMGEDAVTLPQFRLSSRSMGLDQLSLRTQEAAQAAKTILEADRRCVAQIQEAYAALYNRMSQNGMTRAERYLVRDRIRAGELLEAASRSIPLPATQVERAHSKRGSDWLTKLLLW